MIEFNYSLLFIITFATIICCKIATKGESRNFTLFALMMYTFIFIYSGIGGSLKEANSLYSIYYCIYLMVLTVVLKKSKRGLKYTSNDSLSFDSFIDKHAIKFILIYVLLNFFSLIYPDIKLSNLLSPPQPDLSSYNFEEEGSKAGMDGISSLIYYIKSIFLPFFYWGLYKYNRNPKIVIGTLLFNLYVGYCASGYMSRSSMLFVLILSFMSIYRLLSPSKRRKLIISCVIAAPFLLYAFYQFSVMRLSSSTENISISQAVTVLFRQEIGYPLHFNDYFYKSDTYVSDFLGWLILLPLPGFLKFGHGMFALNKTFSMLILGLEPSDQYFYVVLPGIVGEAIFVFGPFLFFVHAIILGMVIRYVMNTCDKCNSLIFVFYYYMVQFSFGMSRAGTISIYPSVFKYFVIIVFVLYMVKRKKKLQLHKLIQ